MLYRDVAPKLGWKSVVGLHTPCCRPSTAAGGWTSSLQMSNRSRIPHLVERRPDRRGEKISKAFCPAKETKGNPVSRWPDLS